MKSKCPTCETDQVNVRYCTNCKYTHCKENCMSLDCYDADCWN